MLNTLKKANIDILYPDLTGNGTDFEIDGDIIRFAVPCDSVVVYSEPHYKGNSGFFHIFVQNNEVLLLKSCYSDFIRVLKGTELPDISMLSLLSRVLLRVDNVLDSSYAAWAICSGNDCFIVKVKSLAVNENVAPILDLPRPLNTDEYQNGIDNDINNSALLSRSIFNTVLPEHLSYLCSSLLRKYPNLLHSYFQIFETKVTPPSLTVINLRTYMNVSGMISAMNDVRIDKKLFAEDFMPWQNLFNSEKKPKMELLNTKNIPLDDMYKFFDIVDSGIDAICDSELFQDTYFDPLVQMAMAGMSLYFLFAEQFAYLMNITGFTAEQTLRLIYTTRKESFFVNGVELMLPLFFDPINESKTVKLQGGAVLQNIDELLSAMPSFKHWRNKKRAIQIITSLHKCLNLRDRLVCISGKYHGKVRNAIYFNANHLVEQEKLRKIEQIFFLGIDDIRKLMHGTYNAGLAEMLSYYTSYSNRTAAQVMPYELYSGDTPYVEKISKKQYSNGKNKTVFPCKSYCHADAIGHVKKLDLSNMNTSGEIYCARAIPLATIPHLNSPKAILVDVANIFSYITEYALMSNTPLYIGLRHSELLLVGKNVTTQVNEIKVCG